MEKELGIKFSELQKMGDWHGAFQIVFDVLERSPQDLDASRMTAATLAENEQVIPDDILEDPRLDLFYCHCDLCGQPWIPKLGDAARTDFAVLNPPGIQCDSCGGVFCNRCYRKAGDTISCPRCFSKQVAPPSEPNGRRIGEAHLHIRPPEKKWWQIWR